MTAYYNEFNPEVAEWIRELVKAGLVASGDVDERSILDVRPDDLLGYTQCHFFAGVGGWSYALRLAGWPDDRPIWTGSPPCQPFSVAGRGDGKEDERHLAPHFLGLVRACRPPMLFGEQVASAAVFGKVAKAAGKGLTRPPEWAWLDDVSDRLEAAHYAVGASDFPSAGVGAPHIRQRTFFGACDLRSDAGGMADPNGPKRGAKNNRGPTYDGEAREWDESTNKTGKRGDADGLVNGQQQGLEGHGGHGDGRGESGRIDANQAGSVAASGDAGRMGDTSRPAGQRDAGSVPAQEAREHGAGVSVDGRVSVRPEHASSGVGGMAYHSISGRGEERQDVGGRLVGDCPQGVAAGLGAGCGDSRPGPTNGFWSDADWLFCRDGKWRPVESGTFPLVDGLPKGMGRGRDDGKPYHPAEARKMRLSGYGNAINPWAAAEFIGAFEEAM